MSVKLRRVALPEFGAPAEQPTLPASLYAARFARTIERFRAAGLAALAIYADREHSANMSYLTGFDPRFEEALLVIRASGAATLLTGPENQGMAAASPLGLDVQLYPPFGLMGQDRSKTPALDELLRSCGLGSGMAVGMAGWKYFGPPEAAAPELILETPAYLVDAIRRIVGSSGRLINAGPLLMHPSTGLRAINEIEQLAAFEFAACHCSNAVHRVITGLSPGLSEFEAAARLGQIGLPLNCHPMLSAGPRAAFGLGSPSSRRIAVGDPITVAYGVQGALTARAGWVAASAGDLPPGVRDYVERLAAPYFAAAAEWYETVGIGVTGDALDAIIRRRLGDPFFGDALNPGHLIHLDEWMNTPIHAGSTERLLSGQALQIDIIPATGTPYFTSNIEDGIALLDVPGRAAFAERYPEAAARIQHRREFMAGALGIRLKPEVLPLGNMPGYLTPFFLSPDHAFVMDGPTSVS